MVDYSPALMTDMYEYTMLDAALKDGTADRKCVFEVFTRHLPEGRRYGVVAGTGRILDALEHFPELDEADLKFLADRHVVSPGPISGWRTSTFSGTIRGYREGEMFFPNSPNLQVEGTFGECTLLETLILSSAELRFRSGLRRLTYGVGGPRIVLAWIWADAALTVGTVAAGWSCRSRRVKGVRQSAGRPAVVQGHGTAAHCSRRT